MIKWCGCVLFPAAALALGCWWASWAGCPLLDMSLGEVTQWPLGPSGTSPLRNNSALTSGNLPSLQRVWGHVFQTLHMFSCFLSSPAHCINTALQLWKYAGGIYIRCYLANNGPKHATDTVQVCHMRWNTCNLKVVSQKKINGIWKRRGRLPHGELMVRAVSHRWLTTSSLRACHCHLNISGVTGSCHPAPKTLLSLSRR